MRKKQQAKHSDLSESDYVDATCSSQFSKMLPYVPTVRNVISESREVHSFPTGLGEQGNSANMMTENRIVGQKIVGCNERSNSIKRNDKNRVDESMTEQISSLLLMKTRTIDFKTIDLGEAGTLSGRKRLNLEMLLQKVPPRPRISTMTHSNTDS